MVSPSHSPDPLSGPAVPGPHSRTTAAAIRCLPLGTKRILLVLKIASTQKKRFLSLALRCSTHAKHRSLASCMRPQEVLHRKIHNLAIHFFKPKPYEAVKN